METFEPKMGGYTASRHAEDLQYAEEFVLELRDPIEKILEELSPLLESGEIQLIIGDDASGRIPTAIFRKIFDKAYKERGFITPETRFLAGGRSLQGEDKKEKEKKIAEYMEQAKGDVEKKFGRTLTKVLVVTDVINTGESLDPLMSALNKAGIEAKVASIGVYKVQRKVKKIEERWKAPIFSALEGHPPHVYGQDELSGVQKSSSDLFAHPFKASEYRNRWEKMDIQEEINKGREVAEVVAESVYEDWKKKHQK